MTLTTQGSQVQTTDTGIISAVNLDAAKLIADLAQKSYAEEGDRFKSIDGKTTTLIGATGAGLLFLVGTVGKLPDFQNFRHAHALTEVYFVALGLALLAILVAEAFFFLSLRTRTTQRVQIDEWVNMEDYLALPQAQFLVTQPEDLLPKLASRQAAQ